VKARSRRVRRERGDAGVSSVEVILIAPVMAFFSIVLVYLGLYVDNIGKVQSAAQDAARMGSLQRGLTNETKLARDVAWADVGKSCNRDSEATMGLQVRVVATTGGTGTPSQVLEVTVTCDITVFNLSYSVVESAYAPLNAYSGQR